MKERVGHAMHRGFDRMRHRSAFGVDPASAVGGGFDRLRGSRYALLVTFRRSGEAVPSPVWVAVDGEGRAFVRTAQDAAKVRRIRNDPAVLLAPSSGRGRPTAPATPPSWRGRPEPWSWPTRSSRRRPPSSSR